MIYMLRHGLDDERFIGGWSDVGLVDDGIKQVEEVAAYLCNLPIDRIISSDVNRTRQTTLIVNRALNVEVTYDSRLRELDKGILTGLPVEEVKMSFPKYLDNISIYDKYPNGEAMIDLYNRIKILIEDLKNLDNTLLITHRGVINMIYYIFNEIALDMEKKRFDVTHASVHEVVFEKKKIRRIY